METSENLENMNPEIENSDQLLPLSGVRSRSTYLEHIPITSLSSYPLNKTIYDKFSVSIPYQMNNSYTIQPIRPTEENSMKKCVYMYEDKYTFSRILPPGAYIFNSHFECGNLHSAHLIQLKSNYTGKTNHIFYDLYMHEDVSSMTGTAQWFYFSVTGMKANQTVTFSIRNFSKAESLYDVGMKPLFLSTKSGSGWTRCGSNVSYREETESKELNNRQRNCRSTYYVLTFTHTFDHEDDLCYFAYSHPYTYTDLRNFLNTLSKPSILSRTELCKTLAGNVCDLLTITNNQVLNENTTESSTNPPPINKPHILLTARVHPGEVSSSWIMQGVIEFLLSDTVEANQLRDMCVFKIIPMLNPDGVINGNNRTSLSGQDLNRVWDNPKPDVHPTIYQCKKLAQDLQSTISSKICLFLDLHGHSKHKGIFAFGCVVGDDKEDIIGSSNERNISPSQLRMKVLRSNSLSSGKSQISETTITQTQGIAISTKERSRSAGPQGRRRSNNIPTPPIDPYAKKSSQLETESTSSIASSTRSISPAQLLDMKYQRIKKLPKIFNKRINAFSQRLCSYRVPSNKLSTSRAVMALEIGVEHSYTIEASMAGSHDELFNPSDYLQIGSDICSSIHEWLIVDDFLTEFSNQQLIEAPEVTSDSEGTSSSTSSSKAPRQRIPPRRRTLSEDPPRSHGIASNYKDEKINQENRNSSISPDVIFSDNNNNDSTSITSTNIPISTTSNNNTATSMKKTRLHQLRQQSREDRIRVIPAARPLSMFSGNIVFDETRNISNNQLQLFSAEGKTFQNRKIEKSKPPPSTSGNLSLGM